MNRRVADVHGYGGRENGSLEGLVCCTPHRLFFTFGVHSGV